MKYNKQVEKEQYLNRSYLTEARWASYWHQIKEVSDLEVLKILEVGPGNNIVSNTLKEMGYEVKTLDIDKRINPDYVDDILNPGEIKNEKFDLVLACQILEHLEYSDFLVALRNLSQISKKYLIISLPIYDKFKIKLNLEAVGLKFKKIFCFNLFFPKPEHIFKGEHYWAIGKKNYDLERIRKDMIDAGMSIKKEFRPFEKTNHYFFVLEKTLPDHL